ncbi:MAG: CHAT domain-containing tetratricopeptide repeat protein [Hyphomicrobiaceae bacterium]|nr:CHAT domain-containing tetratricopeptide repeat protein [Hyphomicrobiaceae bacterium]
MWSIDAKTRQGLTLAASIAASALVVLLAPPLPVAAQTKAASRPPSPALKHLQEDAAELFRRRQWPEAVAAAERTLAAARAELGPDHEQVAIQAYGLGLVAEQAGRLDVAERAFRENIRVGEAVYGKDSAAITQGMEKLAEILVAARRSAEAEPLLRHVLAIRSGLVGAGHSYNASTHAGLGAVSLARGQPQAALAAYREAVRLLTGKRETQTVAAHVMDNEIRRQVSAFSGLVEAAWRVSRVGGGASALVDESFAASQRAWTTSAASALQRMSARLAAGDTDLGRRVRRQQDAVERVLALHQEDMRELTRWSEVQRKDATYSGLLERFRAASIAQGRDNAPTVKRQTELVAQLQEHLARCPPGQRKAGCEKAEAERGVITKELGQLSAVASKDAGAIMAMHREMEAAEARLPGHAEFQAARKARIDEQTRLEQVATAERNAILARFPDYVALTEPEPLSVKATQALLGPTEALVTLLVGPTESFVWAVTGERVEWARIDAGSAALAAHVSALRHGLDPLAAPDPASGQRPSFDIERAAALYRLLLGPVDHIIRDKPSLVLVPTGPLTSLPFQALVTGPVRTGSSPAEALREAPWLARRHATSVLPSVPSLAALRRVGAHLSAAEPFLGIGDPSLTGPPGQSRSARIGQTALAAIYRNGVADLRALRELTPLPETAAELKAIAGALKAPADALLLGHDATETRVRRTPLDRYRVIHFATHGLVAGELSGLAEPALVLTPPIRPSEADDGLLTASEVAALRLKADWVVLSACNTAAGADVGAEALSGLARAFFFAGARALLVSHWAVNSEATVWLTTETFAALSREPRIGRAEAFRRTMIAMIDAGLPPSMWAPFIIVGEGEAAR